MMQSATLLTCAGTPPHPSPLHLTNNVMGPVTLRHDPDAETAGSLTATCDGFAEGFGYARDPVDHASGFRVDLEFLQSRLFSGDFKDPLVGRDILIGAVLGGIGLLLRVLILNFAGWIGMPPVLPHFLDDNSIGITRLGYGLMMQFSTALYVAFLLTVHKMKKPLPKLSLQ